MDEAMRRGMTQLGCNFVLDLVLRCGEAERASALSELAWWTPTVEKALETWSPI